MTDREIADLIALCSQWWTNFRPPESLPVMVKAWQFQLADVPYEAAQAALSEHSAVGSEFPPPVGVIRRRALQLVNPAGRAPGPDEAWANVQEQISRVGLTPTTLQVGGRQPEFLHPAITSVVGAMGWRDLCESTNAVADRAHFMKLYAERVERDVQTYVQPPAVKAIIARTAEAAASIEAGDPVKLADLLPMKPVPQ